MSKFRVEFYSTVTNKKEIAMMSDRGGFLAVLSANPIDYSKDILIFEKRPNWELAYHIRDGERIFKDFSEDRQVLIKQQEQAIKQQEHIENLSKCFDTDICPARKENKSLFEVIVDGWFFGEDISKPKLEVVKKELKEEL